MNRFLAVLALIVLALPTMAAQKKDKELAPAVSQAFANATILAFVSTGPSSTRFDCFLVKRAAVKQGGYNVTIRLKATKDTMPLDDVQPGIRRYYVSAAHAKKFFGDIKDKSRVVFGREEIQMKNPTSKNPTDYLYLERP